MDGNRKSSGARLTSSGQDKGRSILQPNPGLNQPQSAEYLNQLNTWMQLQQLHNPDFARMAMAVNPGLFRIPGMSDGLGLMSPFSYPPGLSGYNPRNLPPHLMAQAAPQSQPEEQENDDEDDGIPQVATFSDYMPSKRMRTFSPEQ
jgi:hypothetical protein